MKNEGRIAVVMGDLGLVRALALAGVRSVVISSDPGDVTLRSRHVVRGAIVPGWAEGERAETAALLCDLGKRLRRERGARVPLFYGTDAQLEMLHDHRAALEPHYAFLLNDDALGRALLDKERFSELATRTGVPVPQTARADDRDAVASLREPLLVKPRAKVAWRHLQRELFDGHGKARIFARASDLWREPAVTAHAAELLVQSHVPGTVRDLHSFHGFATEDGRLVASYCGRKIRTFPNVAGESSFIELTRDPDVDALGRDVVRRLGVRGVFKIDLVRDPRDQKLYVLEINARFNLWNYLGAAHGVNLLGIAYDHLTRGAVAPGPVYVPRYRWLNLYRDLRACRESTGEGRLRFVRWAASLVAAPKVYEAFAWGDPWPFAVWAVNHVRGRVA